MTGARFKELVNLYLDREINPRDFQVLRSELGNPERKQEFERLRRIHQAEKQVLALICGNPQRALHRDSLTQRASRAINEARVKFEERRKGLVLLCQFSAATAAICVTVGLLYQDSVDSLEVESDPETNMAGSAPKDIHEHLLAQLQSPNNTSRLIIDESGRALALVSYRDAGEIQIQPLQTVPESSLFRLGKVLEAARPQLPDPSELLEKRNPTIPVRQLPGTSTPIVLVEETQGPGVVVGYAY